ncbi:MAG: response regulator [Candidatus Eisenbacteria bacterium]|uniref:Response regulator n=2 Tax=Eiseniibacteriota bacterium TaxID=2212470 RepID=A0A538SBG5_UNCEI|nr:MAG: response regulator [Candidatus Eisenbacteria bacterium]
MPFHLLVVDDEAHSRKLLRMVLRQGDYTFLEAESGEQALQIMETQRVDLLLLDLMMPHPNGFDVILTMKKSETLARIPFIVASASTAQDDIQRSLELGAIDYFTKPLSECDIRFQIPLKVRNAIALHQASEERLRNERMKAVSAMAVALNHEINNPLQVIQGNAQLLHVHPGLPQDARDKVARIRAATETVAGLTQRIAALRDIVTVDYPAGNKNSVPMVNFEASAAAGKKP